MSLGVEVVEFGFSVAFFRLEDLLHEEQYAVSTAASGAEALARLESERFDVIVTDLGMPGRDGSELVPVDLEAAAALAATLRAENFEAVAVCLLHGYLNSVHEQAVVDVRSYSRHSGAT